MPIMNGLQLCKQIKQNLRTCHIPIIMQSAKTDLKEQLEGLQVGADDYIPKPFSMTMVAAKSRTCSVRAIGLSSTTPIPWKWNPKR